MNTLKLLFEIPEYQLKKNKLKVAFATKYNGKWRTISSEQYVSQSNNLSKALVQLGVKPNDKIAIITDRNRVEWHVIDIAILQIGAQSVPVYGNTNVSELTYIFNHAEITHCFVSNEALFHRIDSFKDKVPTLKEIISFEAIQQCKSIYDLIEDGKKLSFSRVDSIKKTISENDLATIIYTSGTTDVPKGVMLSHKNIMTNMYANSLNFPQIDAKEIKTLSFLPISHIFERMMNYLYQYKGVSIYFAESIETIGVDLNFVKPHTISVVPRLLEKIHDGFIAKGKSLPFLKRKIYEWALEIGYQWEPNEINGKSYERSLARARKLVFNKWHAALGGNLKVLYSGSAKLQSKLVRIFCAAELYVMDGYGLTETSPVVCGNIFGAMKIGSIGKPITCWEDIKIAEDGEILTKGPSNMLGYYKDPAKTEKSFKNGYFYTGDLGKIDKEGFIYITGRKKESFKTSGGKYINPGKIEFALKKSNLIEQVVVIGEFEKMPAAIIQPNFVFLNKDKKESNEELANDPKIIALIQKEVDKVNVDLGQWEKIKRFELTPDEWTTEEGHLTPTLKVKRDVIKAKYYDLYNKIYRPTKDIIN